MTRADDVDDMDDMDVGGADESPIDAYLDDFLTRLRGRPAAVRRVLAEAEDHLRAAAAEGVASGLDETAAARQAVERFGSSRLVARQFGSPWADALTSPAIRQAVASLMILAAVGMVAIGLSGALAGGMGLLWGKSFVSGDAADITYTPARCADFMEYFPHAATCREAAANHHFDEIVQYRLAAGVLGVASLAGLAGIHVWWRRRRQDDDQPAVRALPEAFVPTFGSAVFGAASAVLAFDALNLFLQGNTGTGAQLSAAIVSGGVALFFGQRLVTTLARA